VISRTNTLSMSLATQDRFALVVNKGFSSTTKAWMSMIMASLFLSYGLLTTDEHCLKLGIPRARTSRVMHYIVESQDGVLKMQTNSFVASKTHDTGVDRGRRSGHQADGSVPTDRG